jgi:single-strand DNA-binding protein
MALNLCQFMGNLGQDPELRFMPDGRAVVNISIACTERWKDKATGEQKENTEWIRAVGFGKRAEIIAEYFKKGSQIYVSGKMRTRSWEKDGAKHYTTEIVIDDFQFCGQRGESGAARAEQQYQAYQGGGAPRQQPASNGGRNEQPPVPNGPPDGMYDDFDDSDIPF